MDAQLFIATQGWLQAAPSPAAQATPVPGEQRDTRCKWSRTGTLPCKIRFHVSLSEQAIDSAGCPAAGWLGVLAADGVPIPLKHARDDGLLRSTMDASICLMPGTGEQPGSSSSSSDDPQPVEPMIMWHLQDNSLRTKLDTTCITKVCLGVRPVGNCRYR